ncbi:MOSC domain-containing protein 2, mitochondrial [Heterocephalus glaber]|uniref:Mitochondrial amidoxime reducing component 2 n=1 Tax=Heterocephalus glaber TaxID=10181 RepID=G5AQS7_HETGA|nr:MOSC domain-containing protein 2, mitochondrial [Heterocephalus glaber]
MVVKEDGHMVTARQEPRLVLVSITSEDGFLVLRAPGMDQLALPYKLPSSNKLLDCRGCPWTSGAVPPPGPLGVGMVARLYSSLKGAVGGTDPSVRLQVADCAPWPLVSWEGSAFSISWAPDASCLASTSKAGIVATRWSFLKSEAYRLVQFETSMKGRTSKEIFPQVKDLGYQVPYPDASPVLLHTEASLVDLNTRLGKKVKMEHFRPNIVVGGCDAFEEDTWEDLVIGDVELKRVMSCPRCILTTVDPDTGILDRKEPLQTLKSYRLCDPSVKHLYQSSPLFGVYFMVEKIGVLRVGDPVYQLVD